MSNLLILLRLIWILVIIAAGIVLVLAPLIWIARSVLSPIDQAAKYRQAPVRFSIGDFLCLFLAIQIPLAVISRFVREADIRAFWIFTIITWLVAPVIWFACARALSKAQVTTGSHRFVFLGLIMPLVYYGLIPFTLLGPVFLGILFGTINLPVQGMILAWLVLAILFFVSGRYVKWMLRQVQTGEPLISDREHENKLLRTAMLGAPSAGSVHRSHSNV